MDNFLIGQKIVLTADARFAPFKCLHCPKLFINKISLDKHWIKHHPHTYDYQNGSLFFQEDEIRYQNKKEIYDKNNTLLSQIGQYRLDKHNEKSAKVNLFSKTSASNYVDSNIYRKEPLNLIDKSANSSRQNVLTDNWKNRTNRSKRRKNRTKELNQSTSYSLQRKNIHVQTDKTIPYRCHYGSIPLATNTCNCCFGTCNLHFQDIQKTNNVMSNTVNNFTSKCDESSQTSSYKNNTFISNAFRTKEASTITKPENVSTQTYLESSDNCLERKEIIIKNYIIQTNVTTQTSLNRSTCTHSEDSEDEVDFCYFGRQSPQLNTSTQTKCNKNKKEGNFTKQHFNAKIQTVSNEDETSTIGDGSCFTFKNTVSKCDATTQTVLKKTVSSLTTEVEGKFPSSKIPISHINETTQTSEKNKKQFITERTLMNSGKDSLQINTTTQTSNENENSSISQHEKNINSYPYILNKITQTDLKTNKKDINFSETFKEQEHSMNEKQSIYVKEQASQVEENIQKLSYFVNIPSQEPYKINKKHWDECIQACLDKYDNHSFDISAHDDQALKRKGTKHDFCTMSKKWDEYTQSCLDKQVKVNSDTVTEHNESFTKPGTQCNACNENNPHPKHLDECIQTCLGTNENQTYDILAHSKTETKCNVNGKNDAIEKHLDECSQSTLDKKESQSKEITTRPKTQCSVCHRNDTITTHLDECIQTCFSTNENQVQAISACTEQTFPKLETKCIVYLENDTNKEQFDECIQTCLIENENKIDDISADNQTIPKLRKHCNISFKSDPNKNNIDECIQTCLITNENQIFGTISSNNEQTIPKPGKQNIVPNNIFSNKIKLDKYIQISCENEKQPFHIVAHNEQDIGAELDMSNKYDINNDNLDKCVQICFDPNINISSVNNTENKFPGTQLNNISNCNNDMLPKSVYTLANLKQFEITTPIKKLIKQNEIKSVLNFQTRCDDRASVHHFIEHINHYQKLSSRCGGDTKTNGTRNNEITDKSSTPESSHTEENSISEKSHEQKSNDDFTSNQHASIDFNNEKSYGKGGNISPSNIGTSENIVRLADSDELLIPQNQQHLQESSSESDSIKQEFYMNLTDLGIGPDWKLLKDESMQKSLVLLKAKRISMKKSFSSLREKIRDEVDWFVKEKMLNNTIK